ASSANGQQPVAQHLALLQAKKQQAVQQSISQVGPHQKKKWMAWTGFSGKTLWDWLQLFAALAVPLAIAVATLWFSAQQNQTSLQLSDKQHQADLLLSKQQHDTDLQI